MSISLRNSAALYYVINCFKGGISVQRCGWMGTSHLWVGAVSDTDYNKRAGYMEEQEQFAEKYLVLINSVLTLLVFMNKYDKGCRAKAVTQRAGKQLVLQPAFAESDKHFNRNQALHSASMTTERGDKERASTFLRDRGMSNGGFCRIQIHNR